MRFVNKFSISVFILIGFLISFLFPENNRLTYFSAFLTIAMFILGVLIYKYKCVNLVAGIENNEGNVERVSNYIGKLMFLISFTLGIASVLSLLVDGLYQSWYSLFFIIPIISYTLYCLVKINQA